MCGGFNRKNLALSSINGRCLKVLEIAFFTLSESYRLSPSIYDSEWRESDLKHFDAYLDQ